MMSPERMFLSTPLVKLGDEFKNVGDFLKRFASIPDILELDHLTVSGTLLAEMFGGSDIWLETRVIIKIEKKSNS